MSLTQKLANFSEKSLITRKWQECDDSDSWGEEWMFFCVNTMATQQNTTQQSQPSTISTSGCVAAYTMRNKTWIAMPSEWCDKTVCCPRSHKSWASRQLLVSWTGWRWRNWTSTFSPSSRSSVIRSGRVSNKNLLLWNELLYFIGDHLGLFFNCCWEMNYIIYPVALFILLNENCCCKMNAFYCCMFFKLWTKIVVVSKLLYFLDITHAACLVPSFWDLQLE